jgi:cysteine synthase A
MENSNSTRIRGLSSLIGNTPLLEIKFKFKGQDRTLYAKAENLNMTGSIKDRMAFHMIQKGYETGVLQPGATIIEATSGNTGIAFSAIGCALGHPVIIFMPDWMSPERINLIRSFGAEINLVSKEEGGFLSSISQSVALSEKIPGSFLPKQFENEDNSEAHYLTTGPEIWWQLRFHSLYPNAFIAGVGTGGTVMGSGRFLREQQPKIKIHPLEPSNSPTLSTGCKYGKHRIGGISDEFIPPILDLEILDEVIGVDDGDAIIMAQKLAAKLGLGVGISSGANFLGALLVLEDLGEDAIVITIFPDDNKKYLSTDLLRDEPIKDDFKAPDIQLISVKGLKRACHTCCDPDECLEANQVEFLNEFPLLNCARRA